jgi:hypothetical protein
MGQKLHFFIVIKFIIKTLESGKFQAHTILAQGAKIFVKTHGLNPNFCSKIRNLHGSDSKLAWIRFETGSLDSISGMG